MKIQRYILSGIRFLRDYKWSLHESSLFWEWPNAWKTIFVTLNHITSITVACCFLSDIMHNKYTTILFQVVLEDFHWWRSKKQLNIDSSWQCLSIAQWLQCLHLGELILIVNKYKLRRDKTHTARRTSWPMKVNLQWSRPNSWICLFVECLQKDCVTTISMAIA